MWILFLGTAARAVEPLGDVPASPPTEDDRLSALEAELAALRAELQTQSQEQLLRDAEALAGQAPTAPPPTPTSPSAFNPAITVFGEVLGTLGVQKGEVLPGSKPWIRSLEIDLRADVDPFAKAVAVFAVEQEPPELAFDPLAPAGADEPEFSAAPEELYVDFVALPAGLSLRAGGFRQPFGVTNRAHPHDYPWPDTPAPLVSFLGEEGLNDVGLLASWHVPNPWGKGITLEAGANAGSRFDPEGSTAVPAWIGRAEYFDRVGNVEIGVGGSATGLADQQIVGGDLMLRWRANSWRSVMLLGEVLSDLDETGGYAALQLQPARPFYLGARFDLQGERWQAGGYASYYTSEFLRLRAGARADNHGLVTVDAELTFVFGSHPVEPYWVNR